MNQFFVKTTVLTALSIFLVSSYNTTAVDAAQALQVNIAKPDTKVLAMEEQVTADMAEQHFAELGATGLAEILAEENENTHNKLGYSVLSVPDNILNGSQAMANFGNLSAFNDFYYKISNSCKKSDEAKRITTAVQLRDKVTSFYDMAYSDPTNSSQYTGTSSYGGWGDVHFTGPFGSKDYHGVAGKYIQLISSKSVQVTASTAKWGNSPATVATSYLVRAMDNSGNEFRITMRGNGMTVTKNGASFALKSGRNILSPTLVLDNYGTNGTLYTKNFSFTYTSAGDYMNFSARQTGSAFDGAVAMGGIVGEQMARGTTGSSASIWKNVGAYSTDYNQNDAWTAFGGFGQKTYPVQDGTGYIPTSALLAAGGFKKPNGQPAFKPSEICGAAAH